MFSWLGAVSPWMMWGGLAVASPIIIHLLSKRKFRVVDWAAMDFLLEANRRNRRRVRIEHLILLLLRCAAMLLIASLIARPFTTRESLAEAANDSVAFERIVLLDDSPSMRAAGRENKPAFDDAIERLETFVRERSSLRTGDKLTLLVTSQPDSPVFHGTFLQEETIDETVDAIRRLTTSDKGAALETALLAVEKLINSDRDGANRLVYVVTDMRRHDWKAPSSKSGSAAANAANATDGSSATDHSEVTDRSDAAGGSGATVDMDGTTRLGTAALVKRLAKIAQGCLVVDVGGSGTDNLIVSSIELVETQGERAQLLEGVKAHFEVTVRNAGDQDASDVDVSFAAGEASTQTDKIDKPIPAGGSQKVRFSIKLPMRPADQQDLLRFVPVRAAVGRADLLPYDNERLYSARVETGVRTLIVDGDPGVEFEGSNSEHFFLNFALQPSGRVRYGYSVDVKTENQFEGLDLKSYQLVYLCNVFALSDERIKSLEKWVDDGGGLVVALGDQSVNAEFYNERFFKEGKGLMPIKLGDLMGDETQEKWAQMVIADPSHRVLRKFNSPELLPLLTGVKFFQWRGIKETGGDDSAEVVQAPGVQVPVRLNDPDGSPLIVEMPWGASGGRVLLLTSTLDGDWTDWPADPMYVVFVQEVSRYLMRTAVDRSNLTVGEPIRYRLDPSRVNNQPQVIYHPTQEDAKPEPTTLQIAPNEATQELWVDYRQTFRAGRYELKLFGKGSAAESETESLWYAVHVDADEGVLARADLAKLSTELEGTATIENDFTTSADAGAKTEIWPYLLVVLGLVLGLEQFLGWRFGKKR